MNPFTQLIGLTLFVHMLILVVRPWRFIGTWRLRSGSAVEKALSLSIIASIGIVVCFIAGSIFYTGISDPHSNPRLLGNLLQQWVLTPETTYSKMSLAALPAKGICARTVPDDLSIVNYLEIRKQDFTFEYRTSLAHKYNIADYVGTAEQNEQLLRLLVREDDQVECNSDALSAVLDDSIYDL